jgi:hypothetical protein
MEEAPEEDMGDIVSIDQSVAMEGAMLEGEGVEDGGGLGVVEGAWAGEEGIVALQ